jgi:hypothetical protein
MSGIVIGAVQSTGNPDDNQDTQTEKLQAAIDAVVARIRGAIQVGNRTPLSATAGSVPPEGKQHTLNLAVELLVASTPNMNFAIKEIFEGMLKESKEWLKNLRMGVPVEYPTDPATSDASGSTVGSTGGGGDIVGEVDLTTDSSSPAPYTPPLVVGGTIYSGTVNPNGIQNANVGDQYWLYSSNGELQFVYVKQGTSGNNANWVQAIV